MLRYLHYGNVVVVEVIELSKLFNLPKLRGAHDTQAKLIKNVTNMLTRPREAMESRKILSFFIEFIKRVSSFAWSTYC